MTTITKIVQQKRRKNRYSVYIDDEYSFSLTDEVLVRLRLKEGQDIDLRGLAGILDAEAQKQAMELTWKFLGIRSRSEKEIKDYLKRKKFEPKIIDNVSLRVKELGYINDAKFAKDWANYRKNQGKGNNLIRMELKQKGIDSETIKEVISNNYKNHEEEIEQIKELAAARIKQLRNLPSKDISRRLMGFLARRGYPVDKIIQVLRELIKNFEGDE